MSGCGHSTITGASAHYNSRGFLYFLNYVDPNDRVGLAFLFPDTMDLSATFDGSGIDSVSSGKSLWRVERTVRFTGAGATNPISIDFDYDAKRNVLNFRGRSYPVSIDQIAIIRFDATREYKVDVVKLNDNIIDELTSEIH
ncbi:MAG: hypothetical protein KDA74_09155 [Planctomycetaceae bacterium]|nr:hypothetical protein [Planctomycetaceae bacterium]